MCDLHSDSDDIPSDIEDAARNASYYDLVYEKFEKWRQEKKVKHVNEKVLLAYFEDKNLKASMLWTHYSMLRTELSLKKAFLKRQSDGYHAKKSSVFSKVNIAKFLTEAEDNKFSVIFCLLIFTNYAKTN
ncbi:hypothetical protein NQ317_011484 [Molorchus minor]|uniref:Uncharacterized protein n=1 Tax=Molorchus minor TaxID=1323400 RepID=A0ABQ9J4E1_9CUCU|nr:hypothetical protein NQ317_011484 [Molorchus minor]